MDIFNNSASCFKPLDAISQIFDFDRMLGLARECGLVIRNRKIKPLLVLKAFLELGEGCRHISMSAAWRRYSFLCGLSGAPQVSAGAFIRFMGRGRFQKFLEALADEAAMKLGDKSFSDTAGAVKALSARLGGLRDIIAQDGTEVSANPQAARKAPEAFKSRDGAAAVKMHAAWSLEKSRLDASSFTSAVSSERDEIQFQELNGRLILCDAGYPSVKLLEKLSDQGVLFLLKMQSSIKPSVLKCTPFAGGRYGKAMDLGGERIKLKDDPRLGGQRSYDCVVSYARKGRAPLVLRVVKVFNPHFCGLSSSRALEGHEELAPLEGYCYLITNIPATQLDADQLYALYRLRWNAERQFMALKSGCGFNAGKAVGEEAVRNLLRLGTAAHALKSALAGAFSSLLGGRELSLLKVAADSGRLVNAMIDRALGVPCAAARLPEPDFERLMLDAYGRLGISRLSASNRALGKSVGCTVEELRRPPSPGGSALA